MTPQQRVAITKLEISVNSAKSAYYAALATYNKAVCDTSEFQPGDTIKNERGELAYVHSIRCEYGRPRPICRKIKKDGTPSQNSEGMYGPAWRNLTLHHRPSVDQALK